MTSETPPTIATSASAAMTMSWPRSPCRPRWCVVVISRSFSGSVLRALAGGELGVRALVLDAQHGLGRERDLVPEHDVADERGDRPVVGLERHDGQAADGHRGTGM